MANTTRNIWNDEPGERVAPKKRGGFRRFLVFFMVLAVVLAVVLFAAYRDGTGFDALRRYLNYGKEATTADGDALYDYDASANNRFAVLGNRLVVLSDTRLRLLDPDGSEVWSAAVSMKAPAIHFGGGRAVAYDVGGTELYVLGEEGQLLHITADEQEPLIAATLNDSGYLAVTAEKKGYKSSVQVYDPELELVFAFNSSRRFVTDAYVTNDNTTLAAVTLGQRDGVFLSNVVIYDLTQTESTANYDVMDGLVLAVGQQGDYLSTVTDTGVTFARQDGGDLSTYGYDGAFLREYDLGGDDFVVLLLNRYRSGSVGRLVSIAPGGQELGRLDVNEEVLGLSAAGRYLAVLYADRLEIYNRDLQLYASLQGTDFAREVLQRGDGSVLLLASEYARLFLP
ncbi:MAG: hypothetical protein E7443_03075 [Ruminococcaceae bacterium]|nr:hypothetical protein [Oscillospiraceae bacterium]